MKSVAVLCICILVCMFSLVNQFLVIVSYNFLVSWQKAMYTLIDTSIHTSKRPCITSLELCVLCQVDTKAPFRPNQ